VIEITEFSPQNLGRAPVDAVLVRMADVREELWEGYCHLGVQWKRSPRPVPPTQKTRKTRQGPFDNPFDLNVDAGTNVPNV